MLKALERLFSFFHLTGEEATGHQDPVSHYQGPKRRLEPKVPVGWLTRPGLESGLKR